MLGMTPKPGAGLHYTPTHGSWLNMAEINGVFEVLDAAPHVIDGRRSKPTGWRSGRCASPVQPGDLVSDLTLGQIMLGRQLQTLRFAWRDRLFGAAVILAAAGTHLHEYPGEAIARNQVYLTPTAPVIGRDDVITPGLQVGPGQTLPNLADSVGRMVNLTSVVGVTHCRNCVLPVRWSGRVSARR